MVMDQIEIYFYLSLIELTCGLLIVGTTLSTTDRFNKLYKGKKYFIVGGLTLILKEVFWLMGVYNGFPKEFLNAIVYIFISLGISNFQRGGKTRIR